MNGSKRRCYDSYGCTKEHDRRDKGRFCKLPPKPNSSKRSIAYKEARESMCWLKRLQVTDYLSKEQAGSLLAESEEICKISGSILKTIKTKARN